MKILITGGLGFIGHNVVSRLEQQGHDCLIIDNTTDYGLLNRQELDFVLEQRTKQIKFSALDHSDILNNTHISSLIEVFRPDCVVHLASYPRQKIVNKNPKSALQVMVTALMDLLSSCNRFNVEKFVYVSSSMVYGDSFKDYSFIPENAPCRPKGYYAIWKYTGELLVKDWAKTNKKNYIICRPSSVYGERDVTDRVVSKFIYQAFNNGILEIRGHREIMDFTHVDDCADGIVLATIGSHSNYTVNLTRSDTKLWTIENAADLIIDKIGLGTKQIADRDPSFPPRSNLDIRLARKLLSYDPKINLDKGLDRYIDWFRTNHFMPININLLNPQVGYSNCI